MNFWKQSNHVMSYFKEENFRGDKRLPSNFMDGFLEVCFMTVLPIGPSHAAIFRGTDRQRLKGTQLKSGYQRGPL